jgi:pyroglutamyl-peptidase
MITVLLTGFEPFGGDAANPSGDAVRAVAERWSGPAELITAVLPVTFADAGARMRELIAAHDPDIVIASGLAGNRAAVSVERVAVNLVDARIPDNAGAQPIDEPSAPSAPAGYFATLPVKAIAAAVGDAGIPAALSHSAGTFVCNHVMFAALDEASGRDGVRAGFIHVPWDAASAPRGAPSLPLADITRALEVAVLTSIRTSGDLPVVGGAVS